MDGCMDASPKPLILPIEEANQGGGMKSYHQQPAV